MVNLFDGQGALLVSETALSNDTLLNHWGYFIDIDAGDHRSLTFQAIVSDRLGGMGIQTVILPLHQSGETRPTQGNQRRGRRWERS